MNGIIMNDKVHATDKTNLEIKVSKETFTQMIQDGTLIEGATYKVTGYEDDIVISSKQVGYDNTTSQLAATNSQDAIDELSGLMANRPTIMKYANLSLNNSVKISATSSISYLIVVVGAASRSALFMGLLGTSTIEIYKGSHISWELGTYSLTLISDNATNSRVYIYSLGGSNFNVENVQ